MSARAHRLRDLAFACGLFLLLLLFFWPVTVGDKTLLPADILYQWQPWRAHAPAPGPSVPHNGLVADLVLENYVWKQFTVQCLRDRQLPLWNPHILSGQPFLAAGQHSALYPFSLIYYVFPLARAYGLFTVSQLLLAGLSLYYYARTIRLSRFSAAAGGLVFAFSGFLLVSTVFPMIIAAAAWLPFILAMVERLVQVASADAPRPWRERLRAPLPWLILGSLGVGLQFLAGHVEISYYNLLVLGAYAVWRGVGAFYPRRRWRAALSFAGILSLMVVLGASLGAAQLVPLFELVTQNYREGSQSYRQIVGYAYPLRRAIAFLVPDFFGNPTHHSYVDLYSGQTVSAWRNALGQPTHTIDWGIKNYVEGGAYVSILGLLLALIGALRRPRQQAWFFIALGLFSLSLVFGLPTYGLVFQLPGIRQVHSPFRWVFQYTVSLAVLAAMGAESLAGAARARRHLRLPVTVGAVAGVAGLATLAGLGLVRAFPQRVLPLADRAVAALALAPQAFSDGRMFVSYQAPNLLLFALCLLGAAAVLLWPRLQRHGRPLARSAWPYALLALLVLDPAAWLRGFQPAVDPAPLTLRPAVIEFLQQQRQPFRITAYDTQGSKPLPANTGMFYGLDDVRGYDSIIARQYAEVMSCLGPQELEFNRIDRLTREQSLDSRILDLLNVRYVLTEETIDRPNYTLVHDSELRVYRNDDALPRAFVTFRAAVLPSRATLLQALPVADLRQVVLLEQAPESFARPVGPVLFTITGDVAWPNSGPACAIDAANSARYLREHTIDDPVSGRRENCRGLLLSELWNRCGAVGATEAIVTAADGRQVAIAKEDLLRWPILVVTQVGRRQLDAGQGGPARLAFPPEAAGKYPESAWLQSIKTIEFGKPAAIAPQAPEVEYLEMSPNQVRLRVDMPAPGFLVLGDTFFAGWVAFSKADGQADEVGLPVMRANGTVRAVQLPAGAQEVRFKFSPNTVKIGLFVSFMGAAWLLLLAAFWAWARVYSPAADEGAARRVARNTVAPMALQVVNKAIDLAFAMLMLRLLGPGNAGQYAFAIVVAGWFEILTNFGLNTLLTREVARDREQANRYLWNTTVLRLGLAALSAPLLFLFLLVWPMPRDTAVTIVLLAIGLVPAGISAGLSAVFMAFEVMEIPAAVATLTTFFKVGLGTVALLLGWGFVGLAGVSVVVNVITVAILLALLVGLYFRPHAEPEPPLQRRMVGEAYPLMINHLLATLFFKVDIPLLQRSWGSAVVGWYSTSYKYVDGVGMIPPIFTMAIFPLMSRFASSARDSLYRAYVVSIKLLLSLALLIALLTTVLAYPLIMIIGGAAYLPHSAIALQIIIWYIPLGFINSVTQYVLIAVDKQRFLTRAFVIGLAFNLGANLLLIPRFGYRATAAIHVFSELALFIPFYVGVRRYLAPIPWLAIAWRPIAAIAAAAGSLWLLRSQPALLVAPLAGGLYLALLFGLGTFDAADLALLQQALPVARLWQRVRRLLAVRRPELPQP